MPTKKKQTSRGVKARATVLKTYASVAKKKEGTTPTRAQLTAAGLSRDAVRHHFGDYATLDSMARKKHPNSFFGFLPGEEHKPRSNKKTYIITSPVVGAPAHLPFCKALKKMASRKKAELIGLPVADPAARVSPNGKAPVDKALRELGFKFITRDFQINDNLRVLGIELSAKQILPTTGLLRFGSRGQSLIVPSPKRFLRYVPMLGTTPHAVMTPGACTLPAYDSDSHRSKRTAYLARQDHVIGAIIVEVESDKIFHFRQLTWSEEKQNILDLGEDHTGKKERPQAIHLGDWHHGWTADINHAFAFDNPTKARDLYMHDSFDGASINNHQKPMEFLGTRDDLREELDSWGSEVSSLSEVYEKVYIIQSNHDERLARWILDKRHHKDRINYRVGRDLEDAVLLDENPLEVYFRRRFDAANVIFLDPDESHKIGDVEMSQHGHRGLNGARRISLDKLETSLGPCSVGHAHTPGIWREAWQAGTSTDLQLDYTCGPSSWMWTHIVHYADGRRQMINLIPGAENNVK